ncbi:MAG: methyl-accepting chemotaxis protein [Phycisphaerales bacterium JB065]
MLIKAKIALTTVASVVVAASAMLLILKAQQTELSGQIHEEVDLLARQNVESIASGVYKMVQAQDQALQQKVRYDLNVARDTLMSSGGITIDDQRLTQWNAVNQYTKETTAVSIPTMMVGENPIMPNRSFEATQPVVDEVQELVGGTATIFQRMNDAGDMLRVATNVKTTDGERAVGTFIPAVNPDGTPNPVVSTIMNGETYYGRAYVVNAWYITAYEPLFDSAQNIVGVLYVGVKQESVASLRQGIMDTKVGDTGYVFVLGGSGSHKGHYLISAQGKRDGENIWEAKDSDGNLFIQEIINSAMEQNNGDLVFVRYPWQNEGDTEARHKVSACVYYEPWDWVIGAGTYEDEYQSALARTDAAATSMVLGVLIVGAIASALSVLFAILIAKRITRPIDNMICTLQDLAEGEGDLTAQVEANTRDELFSLATGFNAFIRKIHDLIFEVRCAAEEVAGSAQSINTSTQDVSEATHEQSTKAVQIAAAVEEMSASVTDVAKQSSQAAEQAESSDEEAVRGSEIVTQTIDGMRAIADVVKASADSIEGLGRRSEQIGEIISVINDIADQTNLLALNAAIEAARAGEHGRGFAVVADEVRKLADRTTKATEEISSSIREIQTETQAAVEQMCSGTQRVEEGVDLASNAGLALNSIRQSAQTVASAIQSIAAASEEQSAAGSEIASAVETMSQSATRAAESTGQTSVAVAELADRAAHLSQLVARFRLHENGHAQSPSES